MKRTKLDDAGMTVTELVVASLVMAIVLAIAFGFLSQSTTIIARSEADSQSEKNAQLALRTVTQELRGLDPSTATRCAAATTYDNCLRFTVNRNTTSLARCPKSEFELRLAGGELVMDRADYTTVGNSCPTAAVVTNGKTVLEGVLNGATEPLFTYYASDGSRLDPASAGDTLATVDSLKVSLKVKYREGAPVLDFRSVIALRNNNVR